MLSGKDYISHCSICSDTFCEHCAPMDIDCVDCSTVTCGEGECLSYCEDCASGVCKDCVDNHDCQNNEDADDEEAEDEEESDDSSERDEDPEEI